MTTGDLLTAWTIRLSMLLLFLVMVLRSHCQSGQRIDGWLKHVWTTGFLLSVLHLLSAFHFTHDWSHRAAYLETARETRQKLGFAFGAGIYFNYFFMIIWGSDVCWTWCGPQSAKRPISWAIRCGRIYLLFIAFNGVVVFKSGWLRIAGVLATALIVGIMVREHRNRLRSESEPSRN